MSETPKGSMRLMAFIELPFDAEEYPSQSIEEATDDLEAALLDLLSEHGYIMNSTGFAVTSSYVEDPVDDDEVEVDPLDEMAPIDEDDDEAETQPEPEGPLRRECNRGHSSHVRRTPHRDPTERGSGLRRTGPGSPAP